MQMLMSIKTSEKAWSPPRMVEIPTYVESVAKVLAVTPTPKPRRRSRCLHSHLFANDIAIEFNDVERDTAEGEGMEEDMDSHGASSQDST